MKGDVSVTFKTTFCKRLKYFIFGGRDFTFNFNNSNINLDGLENLRLPHDQFRVTMDSPDQVNYEILYKGKPVKGLVKEIVIERLK